MVDEALYGGIYVGNDKCKASFPPVERQGKGMVKTAAKFIKSEQGFTLIDLAVIMMVLGLLLTPAIQAYRLWHSQQKRVITQERLNDIEEAVRNFYFENNRYPCPANPDLSPDDATFGEEALGGSGDCTGLPVNSGTVQGAVPFQALRLPVNKSLDGWANKMVYVVTQDLANPLTAFNPGAGAITVNEYAIVSDPVTGEDICPNTAAAPNNSSTDVHYTLFSTGETGVGAVNIGGELVETCPTGAGAGREVENCDGDTVFTSNICLASNAVGENFYDDIMIFDPVTKNIAPSKLWETASGNNSNMGSVIPYIGIGIEDPETEIDVMGNIKAENMDLDDPTKNGNSYAQHYCNGDARNCFTADIIAGNDPMMDCGNKIMTGIGSNRAKCKLTYISKVRGRCRSGQYMVGIDARGRIQCSR